MTSTSISAAPRQPNSGYDSEEAFSRRTNTSFDSSFQTFNSYDEKVQQTPQRPPYRNPSLERDFSPQTKPETDRPDSKFDRNHNYRLISTEERLRNLKEHPYSSLERKRSAGTEPSPGWEPVFQPPLDTKPPKSGYVTEDIIRRPVPTGRDDRTVPTKQHTTREQYSYSTERSQRPPRSKTPEWEVKPKPQPEIQPPKVSQPEPPKPEQPKEPPKTEVPEPTDTSLMTIQKLIENFHRQGTDMPVLLITEEKHTETVTETQAVPQSSETSFIPIDPSQKAIEYQPQLGSETDTLDRSRGRTPDRTTSPTSTDFQSLDYRRKPPSDIHKNKDSDRILEDIQRQYGTLPPSSRSVDDVDRGQDEEIEVIQLQPIGIGMQNLEPDMPDGRPLTPSYQLQTTTVKETVTTPPFPVTTGATLRSQGQRTPTTPYVNTGGTPTHSDFSFGTPSPGSLQGTPNFPQGYSSLPPEHRQPPRGQSVTSPPYSTLQQGRGHPLQGQGQKPPTGYNASPVPNQSHVKGYMTLEPAGRCGVRDQRHDYRTMPHGGFQQGVQESVQHSTQQVQYHQQHHQQYFQQEHHVQQQQQQQQHSTLQQQSPQLRSATPQQQSLLMQSQPPQLQAQQQLQHNQLLHGHFAQGSQGHIVAPVQPAVQQGGVQQHQQQQSFQQSHSTVQQQHVHSGTLPDGRQQPQQQQMYKAQSFQEQYTGSAPGGTGGSQQFSQHSAQHGVAQQVQRVPPQPQLQGGHHQQQVVHGSLQHSSTQQHMGGPVHTGGMQGQAGTSHSQTREAQASYVQSGVVHGAPMQSGTMQSMGGGQMASQQYGSEQQFSHQQQFTQQHHVQHSTQHHQQQQGGFAVHGGPPHNQALHVDASQRMTGLGTSGRSPGPSSGGSGISNPHSPEGGLNTLGSQLSASERGGAITPGAYSAGGQSSPSVYFGQSRRGSLTSLSDGMDVVTPRFVRDTSKYWYKPHISREDAIVMLKDKPPGTFVVRDSNSFPNAFGLALKVAQLPPNVQSKSGDPQTELVRHFLIEPTPKGVKLKGCSNEPVFGSLAALVYQHSITPLALPCKLVLPEADEHITTPMYPADTIDGKTEPMNTASALLAQGAACNVLYLNTVDTESLTGPQAVARAMKETFTLSPGSEPKTTVVHFKVASSGITLTDNKRKLFFRRHYPVNSVTFCGMDPEDRRWTQKSEAGMPMNAKVFGFVARKQGSQTDNSCHLFAELDPEQPASAIVNFVTKVMIGQSRTLKS